MKATTSSLCKKLWSVITKCRNRKLRRNSSAITLDGSPKLVKLPSQFAALAPKVQEFFANKAFGRTGGA